MIVTRVLTLGLVLGPLVYFTLMIYQAQDLNQLYIYLQTIPIYYELENLSLLQRLASKELKKVYVWPGVNRLQLNVDKINFIIFNSHLNSCFVTVTN